MPSQLATQDNQTAPQSNVKPKKFKTKQNSNGCYLIVFGGVGLVLGLTLIVLQATIMSFIAEKILYLGADSTIFKLWQKYPAAAPYSFTFFNWTNHKDFFNRSVKLKFEEIGPYKYFQELERVDVVRNDNNNTITFKQRHTYHRDNISNNNGNLSDRLITINYFVMMMAHLLEDWNDTIKDIFSEYISILDPHYYFDTTVDNEILKGNKNLFTELSNYFDFILPDVPRTDGFSWLKMANGNPNFEGVLNIANGINRQFDVLNWNYRNITPYFNDSCSLIKGSLGDVYSYPLNKEFVTMFIPQICRLLKLYFEEEVIVDGILGYKYSITKLSLDNGTLNPENKCTCDGPCVPSGVIGLSSCLYNMNVNYSLAHFYNADPVYLDSIEGLNPEKRNHESYIVIEPNSLLNLEIKVAVQANMFLHPVEGMSSFDDFPQLNFPLFRLDMHLQQSSDAKKYLNMYLCVPYLIIVTAIISMVLGISGALYGLYKLKHFHSLEKLQNVKYGLINT